jgi:hydrogenase small subunit
MANIVWMQTGACSGDSMALLCADRPSIENLVEHYGLNFLWHPSLTAEHRFGDVLDALLSGREKLDILCIEGSLITGPFGTGQFDTWRPGQDRHRAPTRPHARHVVAMGTCAAFGGVHAAAPNPTDCTGLVRRAPGGLLGPDWRSRPACR